MTKEEIEKKMHEAAEEIKPLVTTLVEALCEAHQKGYLAGVELGAGVDDYTYVIYEIQPEDYHFKFIEQGRMQPVAYTMDYEGTLEEGIKHVLTNLI